MKIVTNLNGAVVTIESEVAGSAEAAFEDIKQAIQEYGSVSLSKDLDI